MEAALHLVVWLGWIVLIDLGAENGVGYFHQPQHDLLVPLIHGALFNAALFFGNAFWLMPRHLVRGTVGKYLRLLLLLTVGVIAAKTLGERVIILLSMPSLEHVTLGELALENVYVAIAMILMSTFYRFARDWLRSLAAEPPRPAPESGAAAAGDEARHLLIKSGRTLHRIPVGSVLYVEAAGNYVAFALPDRRILSLMSMKEAEDLLPPGRFTRIHRSYIIGLEHLERVGGRRVEVAGAVLPIGATFRHRFQQQLAEGLGVAGSTASCSG